MKIKINNKYIGDKLPCFIVAEISGNHNGKISSIFKMIDKAKKIGVDAIKIQTFTADTITLNTNKKDFLLKKNSPWLRYKNLWSLYNKAHTPWNWHREIFNYAKKKKMIIFSSPFDETAVDLLESLSCPVYKIASPEINHIPLIKKVAKTKKPIILSNGLAKLSDIILAIKTIRSIGNNKIILLKCTSEYPTPYSDVNLLTMANFKKKFNVIPGISDHTLGLSVPIASIPLGCKLIEKHFCLKNKKNSVDKFFSLNEFEFQNLIKEIRNVEKAIGIVNYNISKSAIKNINGKRSIYFCTNIKKNQVIKKENIRIVRPSYGLEPIYIDKILGKKAKKNFDFGDRVKINCVK